MRLTHIKLAGFKSFTDPTTIHVPGQLVAVIGPNGCGKSNVIDAVRWVLGEASAKQLRGESMQDVIFNGAATRRPAPRASVELVFDNSDHSLQGEWGRYAEVSIKRQLNRQGESGYFINNQPVRRRDITDLFLGTGVGARGYAVIEQGMISRIIEARPEELRAYIEEAAGVSKYKERRRETENRLKDTREHLQRLADLQTELARQVEKLERQASTAERYHTLQTELQRLQDVADYSAWQLALAEADRAAEAHAAAEAKQNETAAKQQELDQLLTALREQEQAQQNSLHALHKQHALLREQIARIEEQIRARQNQQQHMEKERFRAQAKIQELQQKQHALAQQHALLESEIEAKQQVLEEWAVTVGEHELNLPELETAQQQSSHQQQVRQSELARFKSELALKQQQLQHSRQESARNRDKIARLQQEQQQLNLPPKHELQQAQEHSALLQEQYQYAEETLLGSETALESAQQQWREAEQAYQTLHSQELSLQTQADALAQLLNSNHDFWADTPHADAPAVWQHIQAPSEWQHALAAVLAERLYARALSGQPDTLPTQAEQGSVAWFDPDCSSSGKQQPVQALIHQIHAPKPFQAILQHWLDGVLCAPDLAFALAQRAQLQGNQCWLTPEGHRIDRHSTVLFSQSSDSRLMQHKNRHDQLLAQLQDIAPQCAAAKAQRDRLQQNAAQLDGQHRQLLQQQRSRNSELQHAQSRAADLLARTNQAQIRSEHIALELAQLHEECETAAIKQESLDDDIAGLHDTLAELEQQHQLSLHGQQQHAQQLKQAQAALFEAKRQYGLAELDVHKQQQALGNCQAQIAEIGEQMLNWQERQSELALAHEEDDSTLEQTAQLDVLGETQLQLEEQNRDVSAELERIQQQGRDAHSAQQSLNATLPQLAAAVQTALLMQQEALIKARQHHDSLNERAADFDALARSAANAPEAAEAARQIRQLEQAVSSLGAVNMAALEELEEARSRDDYYRSQSQDVQQAIDLLEEAIAQIDNETKSRFQSTFDAVNEKVQGFFPTLFGGGEAKLHMIGDDLLTAGVSIMARPPGKKNSTIHLLSGGEKALTAMSLVFALFSLNPAPFCLLDEVDAPLDDANTGRFCNLVKEMSAQTQFLYISHNRLTMEMAEQLIGVTMQEKGVSRIVAVDIQEALKMAEH